jgi:uncharacterized protein (DUF305 family)
MTAPSTSVNVLILFAVLAIVGCTAGPSSSGDATPSPLPSITEMTELEELYWSRLEHAATRYTDADVHFMSAMIGHHVQALVMADLAPARTADGAIRTLAARIHRAQSDEIAIMEQWLRDRGQEVPRIHVDGTTIMIHGSYDHAHMPGMLTPEQMESLEESSGQEFDRLFLTLMIEHHRGAVSMVHDLFATEGAGQDPAVFKFASDVQVDQATEIARMERMLAEFDSGGSLP